MNCISGTGLCKELTVVSFSLFFTLFITIKKLLNALSEKFA